MTGTEWYSYHVIEQLLSLDKENTYKLYFREKERQPFQMLSDNVSIRNIPWPTRHFWTQGALSLEMLLQSPDFLFVPAHVLPLFLPKYTVTTCHDVGFKRYPELYTLRERIYHGYSMWKAMRSASAIITISEFSKQEMVELYDTDEKKIHVIYNGYDKSIYNTERYAEKEKALREKYNIPGRYLYYVGRKETKKNIGGLIQIFKLLKQDEKYHDLTLVLAGSPGFGYEDIQKEIEVSGISDHIRETDWIPSEEAVNLLKGSDAMVFPSYYEGFGMPVIEAMACGVPVISSNRASLPEICGNSAILHDPDDHQDFANGVARVLSDRSLRVELVEKGLVRAMDFSWEKCGQQTLEVIKNIYGA